MSSLLFGDELNKEVEELTKSHKLSIKVTAKRRMEPYGVPSGRGARGRGRLSQSGGGVKTPAISFLGRGRGQTWPEQSPKQSSPKVSQSSVIDIIGNETPFRAGGLRHFLHEWKKITSDPFILDAVTHCRLECDWVPEALSGSTRPYHSFTEAEQTNIDNEVDKRDSKVVFV